MSKVKKKPKRSPRLNDMDKAFIAYLCYHDIPWKDIANHFDKHVSCIWRVAKERGLKRTEKPSIKQLEKDFYLL